MPLLQPVVVGPLSELSGSVRVKGQLVGASVTVASASRVVAKATATAGDERFALLAGVTLKRTEVLHATQTLGAEQSAVPTGNQGMPVAPAPGSGDLGAVDVVSHLYACGRFVRVAGAVPGADVTLTANGVVLGTGKANEGVARLSLSHPIPAGPPVLASQSAPGLGVGPSSSRVADAVPGGAKPLAAPALSPAPRGCDASVHVTGVFDGATVTFERGSGGIEKRGFDLGALTHAFATPLKQDDTIVVSQNIDPLCKRDAVKSAPVTVGKLEPVDPPQVVGPLCAGAPSVLVTGLRPGATVHVHANGLVFDGAVASDETTATCMLPALLAGSTVSASQTVCQVTSGLGDAVLVALNAGKVAPAEIMTPVFACTGSVSITNAHRGATLQVFARKSGGEIAISDRVLAPTTNAVIAVAPLLTVGEILFVRQWACSDIGVDSKDVPVDKHGTPDPVTVLGPLVAGDAVVGVRGVAPGATVEVLAAHPSGPEFLGSATADQLHRVTLVTTTRPLLEADTVAGRQWLCGQASKIGPSLFVGPRPGVQRRPFYIVGHNPNTIADVTTALAQGANALEPDVQVFANAPDQLCISHGTGDNNAPALRPYLDALHTLVAAHPALSLVVFDCKDEVTSPDHGFELLMSIRGHLTFDNDLNVIISIGHPGDGHSAFFDRIVDILGPREGLMLDAEDEPSSVSKFFDAQGVDHQGYGDGISFVNAFLGAPYRPSVEKACGIRAQAGHLKFIYVWTVNDSSNLREYIRIGVDGIITDDPLALLQITAEPEFAQSIVPAIRSENPFKRDNFAYGLHIHTGDDGTDANVKLTLTGSAGSTSKVVNADLLGRMESGSWNWVTIASPNLGTLQSITVQRDNQNPIAGPDWLLDRIEVRSARFGTGGVAVFNHLFDDTSPATRPIV